MTEYSNRHYEILDLGTRERVGTDGNDRLYRMCKCWCGAIISFNGLGGHLYHKHKQKRKDVTIID